MIKKTLLIFSVISISNFSYAQKKNYLQDSIYIYQQIKFLKKTQKSNNGIFVFDNKVLNQKISKYIIEKRKWEETKNTNEEIHLHSSTSSLGNLFYENPKAILKIIEILKSNDIGKINSLFQEYYSAPSYDYQKFGKINSNELVDLLTNLLYQTDSNFLQQKIIRLFCSFKNIDYLNIVENFIISGKCQSEVSGFVTLSINFDVDKYEKTVDYILIKAINNKNYTDQDKRSLITAIDFIFSQNNPKTRKKVVDYCFEYMNKNIHFPDTEINNFIKTNQSSDLQKYNFFGDKKGVINLDFIITMMKIDDERIIPYLQKLNELGIKNIQSDFILWKYNIDTSDKTFQRLANDYDYFEKVLLILEQRNLLYINKKQLEYLFSIFEAKPNHKDFKKETYILYRGYGDIFSAMKTLYQLHPEEFKILVERHIKSNELKKIFYTYYNNYNQSATFQYIKNKELKGRENIADISVYIHPKNIEKLNAFTSELKDNNLEIFDMNSSEHYKIDFLESQLINMKKYSRGELNNMDFYTDYYGDNFHRINDNSIFVSFHHNTLYNEFILLNDKIYYIEMTKIESSKEKSTATLSQMLLKSIKSENTFVPTFQSSDINNNSNKTLFSFGNAEKINKIISKHEFISEDLK